MSRLRSSSNSMGSRLEEINRVLDYHTAANEMGNDFQDDKYNDSGFDAENEELDGNDQVEVYQSGGEDGNAAALANISSGSGEKHQVDGDPIETYSTGDESDAEGSLSEREWSDTYDDEDAELGRATEKNEEFERELQEYHDAYHKPGRRAYQQDVELIRADIEVYQTTIARVKAECETAKYEAALLQTQSQEQEMRHEEALRRIEDLVLENEKLRMEKDVQTENLLKDLTQAEEREAFFMERRKGDMRALEEKHRAMQTAALAKKEKEILSLEEENQKLRQDLSEETAKYRAEKEAVEATSRKDILAMKRLVETLSEQRAAQEAALANKEKELRSMGEELRKLHSHVNNLRENMGSEDNLGQRLANEMTEKANLEKRLRDGALAWKQSLGDLSQKRAAQAAVIAEKDEVIEGLEAEIKELRQTLSNVREAPKEEGTGPRATSGNEGTGERATSGEEGTGARATSEEVAILEKKYRAEALAWKRKLNAVAEQRKAEAAALAIKEERLRAAKANLERLRGQSIENQTEVSTQTSGGTGVVRQSDEWTQTEAMHIVIPLRRIPARPTTCKRVGWNFALMSFLGAGVVLLSELAYTHHYTIVPS
ncbi:uncharacterized protein EV422DRAFT_310996 [Fimicolochytrium jonesii]|uniref:uncharacterized protein n=1 Tax=Fimicolochytrium jonesii TaxID=1396493 RepID=UPI0022FF21AB|nr:uncharacterized protein EV422DRAFT_310996 [Fimicolochytrium jonesii]KAI8824192.1 hypothetical protein EV422DRAFT_310996 [Fimicolochytrium jonesii]